MIKIPLHLLSKKLRHQPSVKAQLRKLFYEPISYGCLSEMTERRISDIMKKPRTKEYVADISLVLLLKFRILYVFPYAP